MEIKNVNSNIDKVAATVKQIAKNGELFKKNLMNVVENEKVSTHVHKDMERVALTPLQDVKISRYSDVQQPEQVIDSILYVLDLYVKELGKLSPEKNSLVSLHEQLASLERTVDSFKISYREELLAKPALKDIIDSVESLIYVQRFKLNRGDYSEML